MGEVYVCGNNVHTLYNSIMSHCKFLVVTLISDTFFFLFEQKTIPTTMVTYLQTIHHIGWSTMQIFKDPHQQTVMNKKLIVIQMNVMVILNRMASG